MHLIVDLKANFGIAVSLQVQYLYLTSTVPLFPMLKAQRLCVEFGEEGEGCFYLSGIACLIFVGKLVRLFI